MSTKSPEISTPETFEDARQLVDRRFQAGEPTELNGGVVRELPGRIRAIERDDGFWFVGYDGFRHDAPALGTQVRLHHTLLHAATTQDIGAGKPKVTYRLDARDDGVYSYSNVSVDRVNHEEGTEVKRTTKIRNPKAARAVLALIDKRLDRHNVEAQNREF